ncbi:MAG: Restriction endonuclease like protein [Candidatus Tokpelaia hoelldobleri]|uniref:Restriction endonuclease like protein n=1 Tax=Candidatus Tokpelaia hoelldobleri TaxID=1902579 RepID=A0A1U9JWK6_9HYPH|nr:MAG: Restriction endonuclease like protein [Candidatus Tokpelaia hoelldoblerii]
MKAPRLFSIPPGAAYLPVFVEALRAGRLIAGFDGADPLALGAATIYVPTRRAARALRAALVESGSASASFLPDIRTFGDVDEDMFVFAGDRAGGGGSEETDLPPVAPCERLLLLARLVRPWRENLPRHIRNLFGHEDIMIPASTADAVWLARDLARLMDEMETEEADWSRLHDIAPDMVAQWWQVTMDFLDIVITGWPQILRERGVVNPAFWRNRAIRRQAAWLERRPPATPVIVAGATGSLPATAGLVKVIARLPQGAVVLPGLDRDMAAADWQTIVTGKTAPVFGHPQYSLGTLLCAIGAAREAVVHLGTVDETARARETLVAQAFLPAAVTDIWHGLDRGASVQAFANVTLIEAAGEREEALSLALCLRRALEDDNKTAALVTGDRNLARRVAAELKRFGIEADDSGGAPLSETEPATLLRLLLDCIFAPGDPVALLSLLKHPLVRAGQERAAFRKIIERFELFALRGGTGRPRLGQLRAFVEERLQKLAGGDMPPHQVYDQAVIYEAIGLAEALDEAAAPLYDFAALNGPVNIRQAIAATVAAFENFGRDEDGTLNTLYGREAGAACAQFLRGLVVERTGLDFQPAEWPGIFNALIAGETVRLSTRGHPRLFIWGALEARLQTVDTMVIGGLNEGMMPALAHNDPFMSRGMKTTIALPPPERLTGLAAHDFQMALGMNEVVLSRALRLDNAPSVPSRWLQRLETVLGEETVAAMRGRGKVLLHWAGLIDHAPDVPFVPRPCPAPPLDIRPRRFSVTEIETLRRDPYAIYAKKVLRLKPLEPLVRDASAAERGTLYHAILAGFAGEEEGDVYHQGAFQHLMRIARAEFDKLELPDDVEALWWPRFVNLAPEIVRFEQSLSPRRRLAEVTASPVPVGQTGVTLSGRADRIDVFAGGYADILDFKTGMAPSVKQAASLMAPQLALEGALLARGAFAGCGMGTPADLLYIRLKSDGTVVQESVAGKLDKTAQDLSEEAWARLEDLLGLYQSPVQGYVSRAMPPLVEYEGDYDHLARVKEWSAGSAGDDE